MGDERIELAPALMRMQRLLARIVERAEAAGPAGDETPSLAALKAEADLVALAVRTAEKIVEMNKVIALDADAAGRGALSAVERAALRERVETWIDERARARFAEWLAARQPEHRHGASSDPAAAGRADRDEGGPPAGEFRDASGG